MDKTRPQHKALFISHLQGDFVLGDNRIKNPGPGQLLLKIKSTALNPVDWKIQKHGIFISSYPAIVGTDLSGEVVVVGEGVTRFAVGDQVYASLFFLSFSLGYLLCMTDSAKGLSLTNMQRSRNMHWRMRST